MLKFDIRPVKEIGAFRRVPARLTHSFCGAAARKNSISGVTLPAIFGVRMGAAGLQPASHARARPFV
jgi:hypothetical protein